MTHRKFNETIISLLLPSPFYRTPQYLCLHTFCRPIQLAWKQRKDTKAISAIELQSFLIKLLQVTSSCNYKSGICSLFIMLLFSFYRQKDCKGCKVHQGALTVFIDFLMMWLLTWDILQKSCAIIFLILVQNYGCQTEWIFNHLLTFSHLQVKLCFSPTL